MDNLKTARILANIAARAKTLWADGYTYDYMTGDWFNVLKPGADPVAYVFEEGTYYMVSLDKDEKCTCAAFARWGTCKHYLAVRQLPAARDWEAEKALEAQAAEYEAMMQASESEQTGCDPFAEF